MMIGPSRQHYAVKAGICLVIVALIADMIGCAGESYVLTISSSVGGNVTSPGEGMFTYDEGTVVNLMAEAEEGYYFVNWTGDVGTVADVDAHTTNITINADFSITANFYIPTTVTPMVTADRFHTVGLRSDGTVVAVGDNYYGQCDVGGWGNIIHVATGYSHTVALKSDGTVVAVGDNYYGQCNISGWTDIVKVAAGCGHTVGLKSNGTVVAVGYDHDGQCNVGGWMDIVQVAAGVAHTVGLKSDGTVAAVGHNDSGQCDVGSWIDIVQVTAGNDDTVGLRSDGTVGSVVRKYVGE